MRPLRTLLATALTACALVTVTAEVARAQASIDPTVTPALNDSATGPLGPLPSIAELMFGLGAVILIFMIVAYMRYAPRFSRDEEHVKGVRADRVRLGQELPRRSVDVSQAAAVVVAAPAVPGTAAPPAAPPPAAPAPAAPAPAAAPAAPAAAAGEDASSAAEAPANGAEAPPTEAEAPPGEAEAPSTAAPSAEAAPQPPAPAAAEERPEVSLDDEVFQQTLDDLLAKGTSRRVAEGQARRAAMIAARKKAGA